MVSGNLLRSLLESLFEVAEGADDVTDVDDDDSSESSLSAMYSCKAVHPENMRVSYSINGQMTCVVGPAPLLVQVPHRQKKEKHE